MGPPPILNLGSAERASAPLKGVTLQEKALSYNVGISTIDVHNA